MLLIGNIWIKGYLISMSNPRQLAFDLEDNERSVDFQSLDKSDSSLFIKKKDAMTFSELPGLKILLDALNTERENFRNKLDTSWYASPNSLGYWQKVYLSSEFDIITLYYKEEMIGFAVSYIPSNEKPHFWQDISYLYVVPEHRGKGYGKLLVNALLSRDEFETRVWLRPEAKASILFFENLGFEYLDETWRERIYIKKTKGISGSDSIA